MAGKKSTGMIYKESAKADPRVRQALVDAANSCFETYGIKKTTIIDVCEKAGLSRPTFYRFFDNKQDLLLSIALDEISRIASQHTRFREKYEDLDELFTEAIHFGIVESQKSPVVSWQLSPANEDLVLQSVSTASNLMDMQEKSWEPLLSMAEEAGRLRQDKTHRELTQWIVMMQSFTIIYTRAVKLSRKEMKKHIADFVLPSILRK